MATKLRPATNADREIVTQLVFAVLREYGLEPNPSTTDADLADLEVSYVNRGGAFDVLENGEGTIIGCVGLYPIDSKTCELRKMYLQKPARGKGHGKKLLEHALTRAKELGFSRVTLETAAVLKEAVKLYQKYGFRPFPAQHLATRCDQAFYLDFEN
jgi:putative acetyltransferase